MTIKYYCDICENETRNRGIIAMATQNDIGHKFDVCDGCIANKSLKTLAEILLKKLGAGSPPYYATFKRFELESWGYFKVKKEG